MIEPLSNLLLGIYIGASVFACINYLIIPRLKEHLKNRTIVRAIREMRDDPGYIEQSQNPTLINPTPSLGPVDPASYTINYNWENIPEQIVYSGRLNTGELKNPYTHFGYAAVDSYGHVLWIDSPDIISTIPPSITVRSMKEKKTEPEIRPIIQDRYAILKAK